MNSNNVINVITNAIIAATDRGDENHVAVAASRKQGCASPHWLTRYDLQAVIAEIEDCEQWEIVADEIELADAISDAIDLGVNADQVKEWTVLVRVHSDEYIQPSDPREYVIVWE